MKTKLLSLAIACSLALTLCACGGGKKPSAPEASAPEASSADSSLPSVEADLSILPDILSTGDLPSDLTYTVVRSEAFCEGLAWVRFHDDANLYYAGAIDRNGELQFYFPDTSQGSTKVTGFENGRAFVELDGGLCLIDTKGNVVINYSQTLKDDTIIAYGGGCVISKHKEAGGFDTAEKTVYTITDASGSSKTLGDSTSSNWDKAKYHGSEFFSSGGSYVYKGELMEGLTPSELYLKHGTVFVHDGRLFLEIVPCATFICYDLTTGAASEFDSLTGEGCIIDVQDNLVLLACYVQKNGVNPGYYLYNTADGSLKMYEGQYADRLASRCDIENRLQEVKPFSSEHFSGGRFGIALLGADKKYYYVFLDADMNELTEPIQMSNYLIDGDYLISDTGIRSLDGALLNDGSFADLSEAIARGRIAEGAICTGDGRYFDYDGQPLFAAIDYSQAKLVQAN